MNRAPIADTELLERIGALAPDGVTRFSLMGGAVRGAVLAGTSMVARMRANHELGVLETLALGQAYLAAGLFSVTLKDGDRATLRMDCSGVLRGFSVESTWDGSIRGYLFNDAVRLETPLRSFDLKPFIGEGTLSVIRHRAGAEQFTGTVALKYGRIAEDLTEYFLVSEQTRTAVALSVRFDKAGRVAGAGGLFLQAMPGAKEMDVADAEVRLAELPSLGSWFSLGRNREELLAEWFDAFETEILEEGPIAFDCDCSKDRFSLFLGHLQGGVLEKMLEEGPHPAELVCHNCEPV